MSNVRTSTQKKISGVSGFHGIWLLGPSTTLTQEVVMAVETTTCEILGIRSLNFWISIAFLGETIF